MTPDWVDRNGMQAWVEGMAAAVRRRVVITDNEGRELISEGTGEGEASRFPLKVNGRPAGWVLIQPGGCGPVIRKQVERAVDNLRALAESRNSMVDLIQTNAGRWQELTVLYESTALLRGGQGHKDLAQGLLDHTTRALHSTSGAVSFRDASEAESLVTNCPEALDLGEVASWASSLPEGLLFTSVDDLEDQGFNGRAPEPPFLVMPIRSNGQSFGGLAMGWPEGVRLTSEHLKLAGLLAGQAGLAFSNLEMVEQVRRAERIQRDMEVAATIQESILPAPRLETPWFDVACVCEPAALVGGDAFMVMEQGEDALLVGVADVSGHGLPAALLLNAFGSQVQALAMSQTSPAQLLQQTNGLLVDRIGSMGMFVTTALLRFEKCGNLRVANAGHPPPILIDPCGEITLIEES
ncbi:MAG: SpoIIE family protein phosphatase, partial [Thermoanaerobaculales bacterium]|nr:SpoIIE family protein phosphatase [Thermoanaerobaculales bacterium]